MSTQQLLHVCSCTRSLDTNVQLLTLLLSSLKECVPPVQRVFWKICSVWQYKRHRLFRYSPPLCYALPNSLPWCSGPARRHRNRTAHVSIHWNVDGTCIPTSTHPHPLYTHCAAGGLNCSVSSGTVQTAPAKAQQCPRVSKHSITICSNSPYITRDLKTSSL